MSVFLSMFPIEVNSVLSKTSLGRPFQELLFIENEQSQNKIGAFKGSIYFRATVTYLGDDGMKATPTI